MMVKVSSVSSASSSSSFEGGGRGEREKQIEKKWEKEDKTKENSRTRERLTLTISSETPDVLSGFASLMVASSPMMNEGCYYRRDYSNSEVQKHEFHESPFTLSFFATLPSVEIQGLTRTEKEREKMRQFCHSSTKRIHRNFQFEYMVYMVRN